MRTSNPTMNPNMIRELAPAAQDQAMTIQGTVNKTFIMMLLLILTASLSWREFFAIGDPAAVTPHLLVGGIGGFAVAMVTVFKKTWSVVTAPVYAALEGLFLGALSAILEVQYPGIVIQAVMLTFGTFFALLLAFRSGMIRVTARFRMGVMAATGGIAIFYLASFVAGFFGITLPLIHSSGTFGILFSLFVVVVAAMNLVLDFDFVVRGSEARAPKYMEWYAAFGLMVTLIWLYLEILRLLAKLRRR